MCSLYKFVRELIDIPSITGSEGDLARFVAKALAELEQLAETDTLTNATYSRALHLISRGNLPAAMDGLLAVLKEDKNFRDGEARLVLVSVFEILGNENPLTRQYRAELASILY